MEMSPEKKTKVYRGLRIALVVFLAVIIANCVSNLNNQKDKVENTIVLSGHGEVSAVPDIANIDFTIEKDAKTIKDAQVAVAQIEKKSLDYLKENGIADNDIKTADASFYPKYEYKQAICPAIPMGAGTAGITVSSSSAYYCPPSKQVITGYTASESITVKIRNTDDAGKIIEGLGTLGVSNLNGPNFAIDKEDALKDSARKLAIDDAKTKAKELASELGVRLGKITSFNESGNFPMPMYAKGVTMDSAIVSSAPAELPKGENLITSDVTITYEIK